MTQIYQTDSALIRLLQDCNFPGVDVASGPHSFDGSYVQRMLSSLPAIRIVFLGCEKYPESTTSLSLAGRWSIILAVGWNGASEEARRIGPGAGLDLLARAAGAFHAAVLKDEHGERLPLIQVDSIEVLSDGAQDIANLWVAEIGVTIEVPIEIPPDCVGPLDDFIRLNYTFDIEGGEPAPPIERAGFDGDVPGRDTLDQ